MLARESLIRSVLLQLLPLSENDWHLGKVSATTWPRLELCLCKYRGTEGRGANYGPSSTRLTHGSPLLPALKLIQSPGKERECGSKWKRGMRWRKRVSSRKTYQVPLFFPSFHASLEALWKHKERTMNPSNSNCRDESREQANIACCLTARGHVLCLA